MRPHPAVILLDAMGTLVHLRTPVVALRTELARRYHTEITESEAQVALAAEIAYYRAHMQEGSDPVALADLRTRCATVLRDALPGGDRLRVAEVREALLRALRFEAFDEVPSALRALRGQGRRIVVISNWDCSLPDALAQAGVLQWCEGVVSSAAFGAAKPDPAIFAHALELVGCEAADAVHVGDSLSEDVAGARAAGIEAVLMLRDGSPGPQGVRAIRSLTALADP